MEAEAPAGPSRFRWDVLWLAAFLGALLAAWLRRELLDLVFLLIAALPLVLLVLNAMKVRSSRVGAIAKYGLGFDLGFVLVTAVLTTARPLG